MIIKTFKNEKDWIKETIKFIKSLNPKTIALSGGSTPSPLYKALNKEKLNWKNLHFFQVDERYVPPTDENSNNKLIKETLLKNHETNFHFFDTSLTIENALLKYSKELPLQLDLIILGIGEDGHTASLFPNSKALTSKAKVAHTTTTKFAIKDRLTLTFTTILKSKNIIVLLKNKPAIIEKLKNPTKKLPAHTLLKHKNLTILNLI